MHLEWLVPYQPGGSGGGDPLSHTAFQASTFRSINGLGLAPDRSRCGWSGRPADGEVTHKRDDSPH